MLTSTKPEPTAQQSNIVPIHEPQQFREDVIMMIDDEPLMLGILEVYLIEEGYRNFVAIDDSTRAIEAVHREKPDCVFLDINMPEVDGFQILEAIRSNPDTRHLAVIVLTSDSTPATKLKALEMGATDFLEKPIDSSELVLRLRNTLTAKAYQDQLTYCDGLTRLPNRTLFQKRLRAGVTHAQRTNTGLTLLVVSIDRFQNVNDSLGPMAGDEVLQQIAGRLRDVVKDAGYDCRKGQEGTARCLARLGGDEFAISLPGIMEKDDAAGVADLVRDAIRRPFEYRGQQVFLTASLGIAQYPQDSAEAGQLLKHAGAAKELAKKHGRNNSQYYSMEMTEKANERRSLEADLHKALENRELRLHFQPQMATSTGRVDGMEALVRWRHPKRGLVEPGKFIPLAEENDLIIAIDGWVMEQACRQTRAWHDAGYSGLRVSVNVSARQFNEPNLPEAIAEACERGGLAPEFLTVELTESMLMEDLAKASSLLQRVKNIGVSIAIDDFGTGYSSLAYLKRFPIDELKIDRSFLTDVPGNSEDSAIISAVVAMAHTLDLHVVAEGVESSEQYEFLKGLNCDLVQGHLLGAPLRDSQFVSFLNQNWNKHGGPE
jgi:diguanylate cyclase (GGDEF)-like protein